MVTATKLIEIALASGAHSAGIAKIETLRHSPSHSVFSRFTPHRGVGTIEDGMQIPGEIVWPEEAKSILVIAIRHPEKQPEMDWWTKGFSGGTPGNAELIKINTNVSKWLKDKKGVTPKGLPYHIEHGGIFLKDAAVMAGLGCIGRNNMLVTPEFGPRVRLRALALDVDLPSPGPSGFDPCKKCEMPCRSACPRKAFQEKIHHAEHFGTGCLPARTGVYSRYRCNDQMEKDQSHGGNARDENDKKTGQPVKYCRRCEFACPVGS